MQLLVCLCSGILKDVMRDNRVLSLVNRAGLKGTLSQMLDQLQRCQKSLNEFLEVFDKFINGFFLVENLCHLHDDSQLAEPCSYYCVTYINQQNFTILWLQLRHTLPH